VYAFVYSLCVYICVRYLLSSSAQACFVIAAVRVCMRACILCLGVHVRGCACVCCVSGCACAWVCVSVLCVWVCMCMGVRGCVVCLGVHVCGCA